MAEYYRLTCKKVTETGEEEDVFEETMTGFALLGDCKDNPEKMAEIVMHQTVMDLANKIVQAKVFNKARKIADFFMKLKSAEAEESESDLLRKIVGGMFNE